MKYKSVSSLLHSLSALLVFASPAFGATLLEYNFNDTGSTATNSGTLGTAGDLTLFREVGGVRTATGMHTADGGGVSGLAGDRAFNNTTNAMGSGAADNTDEFGGQTSTSLAALAVTSFTITGWFNTTTALDASARLFSNIGGATGLNVQETGDSLLRLEVNNDSANAVSSLGFAEINTWIFWSITYDGSLTSNNVNFYKGTGSTAVVGDANNGSLTLDRGAVAVSTRESDRRKST